MPLTPFNPPEDQLDTVLETLADPDHSLRSAAELLNTTATALSLFLLQPEISERLSIHSQAAAVKARLNACAALPDAATALRHAVNEYTHESLNAPYQLSSSRAVELRRRSRETMRKAASLLLRLATFNPTKPCHRSRLRDRCSSTDPLTSSPSVTSAPSLTPLPLDLDTLSVASSSPSSSQISNLNSQIPFPPTDPPAAQPPAPRSPAPTAPPQPPESPDPTSDLPPPSPTPTTYAPACSSGPRSSRTSRTASPLAAAGSHSGPSPP